MELRCYRVHMVGVTSETIQPDRGPTGMGMAVPGSAVGGQCVLLLWLLLLFVASLVVVPPTPRSFTQEHLSSCQWRVGGGGAMRGLQEAGVHPDCPAESRVRGQASSLPSNSTNLSRLLALWV